jgi:long-chain acyl-CoA synthetase
VLVSHLLERAQSNPKAVAFRYSERGIWHEVTWADYAREVERAALGLQAVGLPRGGRLAIMANPRRQWLFADLAAQSLGGSCLGIYVSTPPAEVENLLKRARVDVLLAERQEDVDPLGDIGIPVVLIETVPGHAPDSVCDWETLTGRGAEAAEAASGSWAASAAAGGDEATVLVVSAGPTGRQKVVAFSPAAVEAGVEAWIAQSFQGIDRPGPSDRIVAEVPLAQPAGRVLTNYLPLLTGAVVHIPETPQSVRAATTAVQPTLLFTPPRLWAVRAGAVVDALAAGRGIKGLVTRRLARPGATPSAVSKVLVVVPLRRRLGLSKVRFAMAAGAPLADHVRRTWAKLGIQVASGYALAECAAPAIALGAGGDGLEAKLGGDGEILVRGASTSFRYEGDCDGDSVRVDVEGWAHTGDLGSTGTDGRRAFASRASDELVDAGGSPVTASALEAAVREHPYVLDALVFTGRNGPVAIVEIDPITAAAWANRAHITWTSYRSLATEPALTAVLEAELREQFGQRSLPALAEVEVLPERPDPSTGECTPTRILRRALVAERFGARRPANGRATSRAEEVITSGKSTVR